MLENLVETILGIIIPIGELIGIFVVLLSLISAFYLYISNLVKGKQHNIKLHLADGLALSLEFKMATEILRTVLVKEINELIVLGIVIILRAVLSFLIHFEIKQNK